METPRPAAIAEQFIDLMAALQDIDVKSEADLSRVVLVDGAPVRQEGGRPAILVKEAERAARAAKVLQERLVTLAQDATSRAPEELSALVRKLELAVERAAATGNAQALKDLDTIKQVRVAMNLAREPFVRAYARFLAQQDIQRYLSTQYAEYLKQQNLPLRVASWEQADTFLRAAGYPDFLQALLTATETATAEEMRVLAAAATRGYPMEAQRTADTRARVQAAKRAFDEFRERLVEYNRLEDTVTELVRIQGILRDPAHPEYLTRTRDLARRFPEREILAAAFASRPPRITPVPVAYTLRRVPPEYRLPLKAASRMQKLGFPEDARKCFTSDGLPVAFMGSSGVVVEPFSPSVPAHAVITVWVPDLIFSILYETEYVERAELGFDEGTAATLRSPLSPQQIRNLLETRARTVLTRAADGDTRDAEAFAAAVESVLPADISPVVEKVNILYAQEADAGRPVRTDYEDVEDYHEDLYAYAVRLWGISPEQEYQLAGGPDIRQARLRRLQSGETTRRDPAVRASERVEVLEEWRRSLSRLEQDVLYLGNILRGRRYSDESRRTEAEVDETLREIPPVFRHLNKDLPTAENPRGVQQLEKALGLTSFDDKTSLWLVFQPQLYRTLSTSQLTQIAGRLGVAPAGDTGATGYRMPTTPQGRMQMALAQALHCAAGAREEDKGGYRLVLVPSLVLYLMRRLETLYAERQLRAGPRTAPAIDTYFEDRPGQAGRRETALDEASDLMATLVAALNELTYPAGEEFPDPRDEDNTLRGKGCPALVYPQGAGDPWVRIPDVNRVVSRRERVDWSGSEQRGRFVEDGTTETAPRPPSRSPRPPGMLPPIVRERLR